MKLKLVVASMSVLGLISFPAFAADEATQDASTPPAVVKHKHHHRMKHHHVTTHANFKGDFKGEMVPAPVVEACPINNWYTPMMDAMNQNVGRAKPTVDCYKPISFAGGIATDVHTFNLHEGYSGENNERISLNDVYLNIFGNVNQYVKAFGSLSYNNASGANALVLSPKYAPGSIVNGSSNGVRGNALAGAYDFATPPNTLTVEQAYLTFADMDSMPVFFQIGKQYTDYGRYTIHPIERTMTQVLTETLRTSAEVAFATRCGVHGSLTAFDQPVRKVSNSASQYAYAASLGWDQPSDSLGWDIGAGYLSSLTAANDITNITAPRVTHYVGAAELHGDINSGPFSFGLRYTSALQSFNPTDVATSAAVGSGGAKPWAYDLKAGYGFNAWAKNQNVYLGYQHSGQAARIALPQSRWILGYGVDVWQNTMLGAEFGHDNAYAASKTGVTNNGNSNTLGLRAAVKFG